MNLTEKEIIEIFVQEHMDVIFYICFHLHLDTCNSDQNDIFDWKANLNFFKRTVFWDIKPRSPLKANFCFSYVL
jgi:hypothetical protein